jgi:flagellar basal body-associated protein FliL
LHTYRRGKKIARVDIAAIVLIVASVVVTAAVVVGMFIWAAVKDGEEDKAVQARLGIRRRTRLGR